jgi:hypothetical protein
MMLRAPFKSVLFSAPTLDNSLACKVRNSALFNFDALTRLKRPDRDGPMHPRRPFLPTLAAGFLACFYASAQEATSPPLPALNLQVLESKQVVRGGRTITYQRVVPPVLPPQPAATPAPVLDATRVLAVSAEQQRRAAKKQETLFLTATVYDQRVTGLRWSQQGREYRAWSNIDFNHLAGVSEIETADHLYQLLFAVSNLTTAEVEAFNRSVAERGLPVSAMKSLPPAVTWSPARAEYQFEPETAVVPVEATAFLDTLHAYYDANRQALAEQAAQRIAEQTAREQWLKDHPPVPKDIVVRFWPIESGLQPTTSK